MQLSFISNRFKCYYLWGFPLFIIEKRSLSTFKLSKFSCVICVIDFGLRTYIELWSFSFSYYSCIQLLVSSKMMNFERYHYYLFFQLPLWILLTKTLFSLGGVSFRNELLQSMSSTTSTTALPFSGLSFQDFGNRFTGFGTFGKKVGIKLRCLMVAWRPNNE